jgi:hypothetical protein
MTGAGRIVTPQPIVSVMSKPLTANTKTYQPGQIAIPASMSSLAVLGRLRAAIEYQWMAGWRVPDTGRFAHMEIVVTSVGADGTVHRGAVDTAERADAPRWEQLADAAHLEVPPPYSPEPGQPVYEIRAGDHVAQVAEQNLAGPLRELVTAVLTEGC